ncbi:MAG: tRNA dihydrouridine synthase DusB [Melioribacteraceae bacterium]|nr:tRNA dihydrouridine synthase DusB [Melioribacteraceae bacterium]
MKIGKLDLGHKLLVAPMADITDAPFRQICKEYGAGLTFTQMVSAKGIVNNNFDTLRLLVFSREEKPIGVQLLGNDSYYLKKAVNELQNYKPDVIDFNCGCPVSKVTNLRMGAALLNDSAEIGKLVKAMVSEAGDIPVSVKLRLGKDKRHINIIDNALAAQDNGASFITIHARTKTDRYSEDPKWEWISKVKEKVNIPVVANGSVFQSRDAYDLMHEYGSDSVMVARGALGNPFLFRQFNKLMEKNIVEPDPGIEELQAIVIKHVGLLVEEYGEESGVNKSKKHIVWYFKNHSGMDELLDNLFACKSKQQVIELVSDHCFKIQEGIYKIKDPESVRKLFKEKVQFWFNEEAKLN